MIRSFSSTEEVFDAIEKDCVAADANIKDWQRALSHGDFFLRLGPDNVHIYGEILDPGIPVDEDEGSSKEHLEALKAEARFYEEEHMQGFRFCRAFSVYCPDGELGDVHVSEVQFKLSKDDFELGRKNKWL